MQHDRYFVFKYLDRVGKRSATRGGEGSRTSFWQGKVLLYLLYCGVE